VTLLHALATPLRWQCGLVLLLLPWLLARPRVLQWYMVRRRLLPLLRQQQRRQLQLLGSLLLLSLNESLQKEPLVLADRVL
jgi:hypothetical protein